MINAIVIISILAIVDIIGYIYRCKVDEKFAKYHLRHIPTMWIWFAS